MHLKTAFVLLAALASAVAFEAVSDSESGCGICDQYCDYFDYKFPRARILLK